ncbi:MAG: hypothetical protein B6U78_02650 [Candidatus Aenigmarchaeota archaeon ex4484_224]|nr:MAG: hypothetical protein B6U78_02650 [Candidatus Aenigmarchaeota archaeon ex4484_224]
MNIQELVETSKLYAEISKIELKKYEITYLIRNKDEIRKRIEKLEELQVRIIKNSYLSSKEKRIYLKDIEQNLFRYILLYKNLGKYDESDLAISFVSGAIAGIGGKVIIDEVLGGNINERKVV